MTEINFKFEIEIKIKNDKKIEIKFQLRHNQYSKIKIISPLSTKLINQIKWNNPQSQLN